MVNISLAKTNNEISKSYWKVPFLVLLISLSLFVFGYSSGRVIFFQKIFGLSPFWFFFGSLLLTFILLPLEGLLFLEFPWFVFLLESLVFFLGFLWQTQWRFFWLNYLLLFLISWFFLWFSCYLIKKKSEELLRLKWQRVTKGGLSFLITGLALFLSLSYYFSQEQKFFLSEKLISLLLKPTTPIVQLYYPNFSWEMDFESFSQTILQEKIEKALEESLGGYRKILPPGLIEKQKKELLSQNLESFHSQLEKSLGITISSQDKLSQIIFKAISSRFNLLSPVWHRYFQIFFVFLLFLFLRFLGIFFLWIAQFFGYLIFEIFLALNFLSLVYEPRTKETVVLN